MPDPGDGRSSRIVLTEAAQVRLPDAIAALVQGNSVALKGFTEIEAAQLAALLTRVIANLDRMADTKPSPGGP